MIKRIQNIQLDLLVTNEYFNSLFLFLFFVNSEGSRSPTAPPATTLVYKKCLCEFYLPRPLPEMNTRIRRLRLVHPLLNQTDKTTRDLISTNGNRGSEKFVFRVISRCWSIDIVHV